MREKLADWDAARRDRGAPRLRPRRCRGRRAGIWLDVDTMADLDDVAADFRQRHGRRLRIATKYWRLTQQFFSGAHGIQVYRIVESLGATEGAPAAGSADVIVDITTTGSTLRANHLKVLSDGVILRSQACLVAKNDGHERRMSPSRFAQEDRRKCSTWSGPSRWRRNW
jgi:ATP phosphoribosyltransferase